MTQSDDEKKSYCCIGTFGFITFVLGIACFIFIALPLIRHDDYDSYDCTVKQIDYPKILPTENSTENWVTCRCGRYCKAYTPCTTLYVSIDNSVELYKVYNHFMTKKKECTFYDKKCDDGENIIETQKKLQNTINLVDSYINKNITCYTNSERTNVYLNKDLDINNMIIIGICFILSCFITMCCCCKK